MTIDRNNMFLFPMESSLYVFVMYIDGYPLIKLDHVLTLAISVAVICQITSEGNILIL